MFRFPGHTREAGSGAGEAADAETMHKIGHFWLCERCSNIYTLQYSPGRGVVIQPLWPELPAAENKMHLPAA